MQSDRSGNAAFLSPLRARPALRCSGQARMARPAAVGKRAQSNSPPYLRVIPACALTRQGEGDGLRRDCFRPARRSRHARSARGRKDHRPLRRLFGRLGNVQRRRRGSRAGSAHRSAARLVRVRRPQPSTRRSIGWSGDWPGTACWSTASRRHAQRGRRSSSSRRSPTIGRERRSSAMPTFSSCRGSPTCDGAATRWCWNRRAPARCSGFAIRRLRPPSPHCRTPQQIKRLRRQDGFPGLELLALLVDCQILFKIDAAATAACDRPRATTTSFFGTFTIFCSTRAARKADTPIRWAEFIRMRASCLRCRRCGPAGPERRSICASSRPRLRRHLAGRKAPARTSFDAQLR